MSEYSVGSGTKGDGASGVSEEIDFVKVLLDLWNRRRLILAGTFLITLGGLVYALLARPVFRSEAIIALRESGDGGFATQALAQFGGMGGVVSSHLGMGSTGLDKIHLVLMSPGFAADVVDKYELLPKLFPKHWDPARKAWKDPAKKPLRRQAVQMLQADIVKSSIDPKRRVITVVVRTWDPVLSRDLVDFYLAELDRRISEDVVTNAEENQLYLGRRLDLAVDPILREKIQNLIGAEIEKAMLVNSSAFDVVVKPLVPEIRIAPKRSRIVITAFVFGFFISVGLVFAVNGLASFRRRLARPRAAAG